MGIVWDRLPGVTAAAGLLAAYLMLGLPASGSLARRQLRLRLGVQPELRQAIYRQTISHLCLLAGVAIGLAGLGGVPVTALGLRAPAGRLEGSPGLVGGTVALAAALLVFAALMGGSRMGRSDMLFPRTRPERRLYVGVALTAGAAEELLFRGFLMAYLTGALGWSVPAATAASALAFGISHLYQGNRTALAAGVLGYALTQTYLLTGSLLLPVVVHIALDLRVLTSRNRGAGASEVQRREQVLDPVA